MLDFLAASLKIAIIMTYAYLIHILLMILLLYDLEYNSISWQMIITYRPLGTGQNLPDTSAGFWIFFSEKNSSPAPPFSRKKSQKSLPPYFSSENKSSLPFFT